jgi:hypothetical protein
MIVDEAHESLIPFDEDTALWRYLDLAKFLALIQTQQLFFSRLDKLGDPLEGLPTRANLDSIAHYPIEEQEAYIAEAKAFRDMLYANCWFIGDKESAGMWRSYPGLDQGIAIRSSRVGLIAGLAGNPLRIRMSKIRYIDRSEEIMARNSIYDQAITKGSFYKYENELRIFHWPGDLNFGEAITDLDTLFPETGIKVQVDVNSLIEAIVISPLAPQWFFDVVHSALVAYGYEKMARSLQWSEMKEGILSL